ncbi:PL29 family lyase N-terminal domain-containing protein [uncultured Alistipes sp.]|uniref:PL29 family lyase N-terminal domain-containing protein n=1 Tax=uncultured Alistipes sp. TaxID=538949 RepID=UPI002618F0EC|nr:PL29 family lyase N-terminal domain-containing protein [uncultured Alistipes sp.]
MKKYLILLFVALAASFQSCDNNDDLWDAIDDLKSRVQALETQVDALNGNIEALQALYSGATISKVEVVDGKYVITLTNGEVIELVQGSEAEAVIPVIGIDENGMWQVSYDGGKTFTSLGVKAEAGDGVTPQFRVDEATGYWQVSYDGGKTFDNVLDTAGNPVSAVGSNGVTDKFFDEVRVEGDNLYIKLLDGQELLIPILKDFLCQIVTPTEGVQVFDVGATKRFEVKVRGVDQAIVTAPEGWTARLTEAVEEVAELVVTAPGGTRATANSSQDVAILAVSGSYSCISKIQVECTGEAPVAPTVSVANSESVAPTTSTLTFDVTVSANADGWKYLCLKSTEEAPDADKVLLEGTAVVGSSVTVEGLEAETSYTIYVVAYVGELFSEVASATNTTEAVALDPNDYYVSGVEIEGVIYNQDSEKLKLATATDPETELALSSTLSVYFLDGGEANNAFVISTENNYMQGNAVFIGRYADRKTKLNLKNQFHLRNRDAVFGFKNLEIDMRNGANSQLFTMTNDVGGAKTLIFEDCDITFGNNKSLFASYSSTKEGSYIENIIFRNCKLRYEPASETSYALFKLTDHLKSGLSSFKTMVFENNVLYSRMGESVSSAFTLLFQAHQASLTGSLSNLSITCTNNTFVDLISYGSGASNPAGMGSAYFQVDQIGSVLFSKNVLYATAAKYVSIMRMTYDYNTNGPWPSIDLDKSGNIVYGTSGWKMYFDGSNAPTSYYPEKGTYSKKAESPLSTNDPATGTFVVAPEYAGYGATLE